MRLLVIKWATHATGHFAEFDRVLPYLLENGGVEFRFLDLHRLQDHLKFSELEMQIADMRPDFLFFTWVQDIHSEIEKINEICIQQNTYFSGLSSLSYFLRPKLRFIFQSSYKIESLIVRKLRSSSQALGLISWDPRVSMLDDDNLTFADILNFYLDVPTPDQNRISRFIKKVRPDSKKVGFFGHLLPQRGLFAILILSLRNPKCDFILVGQRGNFQSCMKSTYESVIWRLLKMKRNCFVFDQYVNTATLTSLIDYVDFVFLDTTSYPNPSGIVDLARKLGKQVLIKSKNSAVHDIYKQDPGVTTLKRYRVETVFRRTPFPSNSVPTTEEAISRFKNALEKLSFNVNKLKKSNG